MINYELCEYKILLALLSVKSSVKRRESKPTWYHAGCTLKCYHNIFSIRVKFFTFFICRSLFLSKLRAQDLSQRTNTFSYTCQYSYSSASIEYPQSDCKTSMRYLPGRWLLLALSWASLLCRRSVTAQNLTDEQVAVVSQRLDEGAQKRYERSSLALIFINERFFYQFYASVGNWAPVHRRSSKLM